MDDMAYAALKSWYVYPEHVLMILKAKGLKVNLEDDDFIGDLTKAFEEVPPCRWQPAIMKIVRAVRRKFFESKEIDVAMIKNGVSCWVEDHLSQFGSELQGEDEGEGKDMDKDMDVDEVDDTPNDKCMEGDDDTEVEFSDWDSFDDCNSYSPEDINELDENTSLWFDRACALKTAAWEELEKQCHNMGCCLNRNEKDDIVNEMFSFFHDKLDFIGYDDYTIRLHVDVLTTYVEKYIFSTCTLDSPTLLNYVKDVLEEETKEMEEARRLTVLHDEISENFSKRVQLEC